MKLHHVLSIEQFIQNPELIREIFDRAYEFKRRHLLWSTKHRAILPGKLVVSFFYEESTRTRISFEAATKRLGGDCISTENAALFSSAAKGETLRDSGRVISGKCDLIVLRHPEIGSAIEAAETSRVPLINAGDGAGEHPTQALLDWFTIEHIVGRTDRLNIAIVGDLKHARVVHSLVWLSVLSNQIRIFLISSPDTTLPDQHKIILRNANVCFEETSDLDSVLPFVDVVYLTRLQKARFKSPEEYQSAANSYFVFGKNQLNLLGGESIIMHPLPRGPELPKEVDSDHRAVYFEQADNGDFIRMALLEKILLKK